MKENKLYTNINRVILKTKERTYVLEKRIKEFYYNNKYMEEKEVKVIKKRDYVTFLNSMYGVTCYTLPLLNIEMVRFSSNFREWGYYSEDDYYPIINMNLSSILEITFEKESSFNVGVSVIKKLNGNEYIQLLKDCGVNNELLNVIE